MAGVLTRQQIEQEVLDNAAKSGALTLQSGTLLSSRVTVWVNRAQQWIARRADLLQATATTSTVASQQSYSFPSNFRNIYTLRLEDGVDSVKLDCVLPWQMDTYVPLPSALTTGKSLYYVPYKDTGTFELYPIPDDTYTIRLRYSYLPSDFTSSTAVSEFTNCDDALIAYGTSFMFRWLQEIKDADQWEAYGNRIIDDVVKLSAEAEQFIDWSPYYQGFSTNPNGAPGDYVNNPFIKDMNLNIWR